MAKRYKTGESQRRAIKAYQSKHKGEYTTISITMRTEQAQADRAAMKEHNTTPAQVWRAAMERLNAEPTPASDDNNAGNE